jgi:hypothetical protein
MRSALALACTMLWGGVANPAAADNGEEKILFVEAPLRLVSQCELREVKRGAITCLRDGSPFTIALAVNATVWKGQDRHDTSTLRPGDRLDMRLGIDADSREVATFVWANLTKVEGVIGAPPIGGPLWVSVYPLVPGAIGEVSNRPLYAYIDAATTFLAGARRGDLRRGRAVIVIGERLDDRRIRANRILLARP